MKSRFEAYRTALEANFMQPDEVRFAEDMEPLGLNWIRLGLQDVLYDPKTKQIYTPNTNQTAIMGASTPEKPEEPQEKPAEPQEKSLPIAPEDGTMEEEKPEEARANPYHDPKNGRFTTGFGRASSGDFANAVVNAKHSLPVEIAWRVTAHTQEDLDKYYPGAKLHVTAGGSTVAVTGDGDIISVCKCDGDTASGRDLMAMAVENGGIKLDSYDGNHGFYIKCGFEPVSWCKWNGNEKPNDWDAGKGCKEENVIFYKYIGKISQYDTTESFYNSVPASQDYKEAQNSRDETVD